MNLKRCVISGERPHDATGKYGDRGREPRLHRLRADWHLLVTHADTGCGNMVGQRDSKKIQTLDNNRRSPEHRHTLRKCGRLSPFSDSSFHSYTFFPSYLPVALSLFVYFCRTQIKQHVNRFVLSKIHAGDFFFFKKNKTEYF